MESNDKVYFGFKRINKDKKNFLVKNVFDSVATKYDLMNDVMSVGIHRKWKHQFVQMIVKENPENILDIGSGTGDIPIKIYKKHKNVKKIYFSDINAKMLEEGKKKSLENGIFNTFSFVECSVENLPFEDSSMDVITAAYSLRNVTDLNKALKEIYRVLKPGGKFFCLEFSPFDKEELFSILYDFWSFYVIPNVGGAITKDRESYEYLVESIRKFPNKDEYKNLIKNTGFKEVEYIEQFPKGISCIHHAIKL